MKCIDSSLLVHSVVALALIVSGLVLLSIFGLSRTSTVGSLFGVLNIVLGMFMFCLAAADKDVEGMFSKTRKLHLAYLSGSALVIGFLMSHYQLYSQSKAMYYIEKILVFGGYLGLVLAIGLEGRSVNTPKLVLAALGAGILAYVYYAVDLRTASEMQRLIPVLGLISVILAISYDC